MQIDSTSGGERSVEQERIKGRIAKARRRLDQIKAIFEDDRQFYFPGDQAYERALSAAKAELDAAGEENRDSKDISVQKTAAEAWHKRMSKAADEASKKVTAIREEQAALAEQLDEAVAADLAAGQELEAAKTKLVAVTARAVAEIQNGAGAAGANAAAEPASVPQPDAASAGALPGYVSTAFAEAKWLEREAAWHEQFQKMQGILDGCGSQEQAPSESAASDIAELGDLEDDDKWSNVPRGRRKALLGKEKAVLASKLRAGLCKVSTTTSPFGKKLST